MTKTTTIRISEDLHRTLREKKKPGESFEAVLWRLLNQDTGEIAEILEKTIKNVLKKGLQEDICDGEK